MSLCNIWPLIFKVELAFYHLKCKHPLELINSTIIFWKSNIQNDHSNVSCTCDITNYIVNEVLPVFLSNENYIFQKIQNQVQISDNNNHNTLYTTKVDFKRISQIILENGILEKFPIKIITSKKHIQFITSFAKLGYSLKSASISKKEFNKYINNIHITRNAVNQVRNDYFKTSISQI